MRRYEVVALPLAFSGTPVGSDPAHRPVRARVPGNPSIGVGGRRNAGPSKSFRESLLERNWWCEAWPGLSCARSVHAYWPLSQPDFPALQCVWPDKAGKFPDEDGFDERLALQQPLLFVGSQRPNGSV